MTLVFPEGVEGSDPLGKKDLLEVARILVSPQDARPDRVTLIFELARPVDGYDVTAARRGNTDLNLHEGDEVIRRQNVDPNAVQAEFNTIDHALTEVHKASEELRVTARKAVDTAEHTADLINRGL